MSKRRDYILGVKALVAAALPGADIRGFDGDTSTDFRIGAGGAAVGFPGTPEVTAQTLSPCTWHLTHTVEVQLMAPEGSTAAALALDEMASAIGAGVSAGRTLGGLVDFVEAGAPEEGDFTPEGGEARHYMIVPITGQYSTTDPLN
ncbi:hypothetical protein [Sphingomonas hengshuiensis]|uniref:hypothetical protein n=1 Tax=Sphingomonas hengshuiensis TaxID=1609977 RepID=UPI0006989412|nr:hypothetical protein [Sphingomonas hengshuiensis]